MNTTFNDGEAYFTYLSGNIIIETTDYTIKSEKGLINHKNKIMELDENVTVSHKNFTSTGSEGYFDYQKNKALLNHNVRISARDYSINADKAELDNKNKIIDLSGNIKSINDKYSLTGNSMQFNIETEEMSSTDAEICLNPNISHGYLDENLYIKFKKFKKENTDNHFRIYNCDITGCDLSEPHYHITAKEMDIITDKRIVFTHTALYFNKNRIISLDKYVLPLDARYNDERVIPKAGLSESEGYYVKFSYPYNPKSQKFYGRFLIDGMTKKGIGLGIKQDFGFFNEKKGEIEGDLSYYKQLKLNNLKGNEDYSLNFLHKKNNFRFDFRLDGNTNYYNNEPDYKSLSYNGTFRYSTDRFNTNLGIRQSKTTTSYTNTTNNYNFEHNHYFGKRYSFNINLNYNTYNSSSYNSKILSTAAYFKGKENALDWKVFTQLYDDFGESRYTSVGTEKKPEITLSSDFSRMNLLKKQNFNILMDTSYSKLKLTNGNDTDRFYLNMYIPSYTFNFNDRLSFNIDGRYKQYYYSKDMALFALSSSAEIIYKFNKHNSLNIDYNFQNPKGYTPVSSDNMSKYRYSNFKWIYDNNTDLRTELFTGYDYTLKNDPWQNLYYKLKWKTNNYFSLAFSTYYDINQKKFGDIISQVKFNDKKSIFEIGSRYNCKTKKLTSVKSLLNLNLFGDYYLKGYISYDGFLKQVDYVAAEILRKHHCYDSSIVLRHQNGYYKDTSLMLYIKLNLFPDSDEFASGQNGETLSSDVGNLYY